MRVVDGWSGLIIHPFELQASQTVQKAYSVTSVDILYRAVWYLMIHSLKCFIHNGTLWSVSKRESVQVTKGKVGCFSPRLICLRRCRACAIFTRRSCFKASGLPR